MERRGNPPERGASIGDWLRCIALWAVWVACMSFIGASTDSRNAVVTHDATATIKSTER